MSQQRPQVFLPHAAPGAIIAQLRAWDYTEIARLVCHAVACPANGFYWKEAFHVECEPSGCVECDD